VPGSNFGWMPFLAPPMTHMADSNTGSLSASLTPLPLSSALRHWKHKVCSSILYASHITDQRETWPCPLGTFLRRDQVPPYRQVPALEQSAAALRSVAGLSSVAEHTTTTPRIKVWC